MVVRKGSVVHDSLWPMMWCHTSRPIVIKDPSQGREGRQEVRKSNTNWNTWRQAETHGDGLESTSVSHNLRESNFDYEDDLRRPNMLHCGTAQKPEDTEIQTNKNNNKGHPSAAPQSFCDCWGLTIISTCYICSKKKSIFHNWISSLSLTSWHV